MRGLSIEDKREHHQKLGDYVSRLNTLLVPQKFDLALIHIAYGFQMEDELHFFDYPYDSSISDTFNDFVNNNEKPFELTNDIFGKFHDFQETHPGDLVGYILYRYNRKGTGKFELLPPIFNIASTEYETRIREYLPIIHSAAFGTDEYYQYELLNSPDSRNSTKTEYQLLVLGKEIDHGNLKGNSMICSFRILSKLPSHEEDASLETLTTTLNRTFCYFLEIYFDSPVLEKLLYRDRFKELRAYQHNLENLKHFDYYHLIATN